MNSVLRGIGVVLLFVASICAQSGADLAALAAEMPTCALNCLTLTLTHSTCSATNVTCICTDKPFNADMAVCVAANCTVKEDLTTQNVSMTLCAAYHPGAYDDINYKGIVAGTVMASIAVTVTALRVAGRWIAMSGRLGADDWLIIASAACAIVISALSKPLTDNGLGRHMYSLPFDHVTNSIFWFFIDEQLYSLSISLTKLSILCFYLRIFPDVKFRRLVYTVVCITVGYAVAFAIAVTLHCIPVSAQWNGWDGEHPAKCTNLTAQNYSASCINIVLDVTICLMPVPQLMKLNLSTRKKVGIVLMFSVGLFVTLVSILRLHTLVALLDASDFTYAVVSPGIWSVVEVNVGIICACMPGVFALLKVLFPNLIGSTDRNRSYYYNNNASRRGDTYPQFSSREHFKKSGAHEDFIEINDIEKPPSDDSIEPHGTAQPIKSNTKSGLSTGSNKFGRIETINSVAFEPAPIYTGEGINVSHETKVESDDISQQNVARVEGTKKTQEPRIYRGGWE